jgi:branched-chain amino acid transport system substrate-binding protein
MRDNEKQSLQGSDRPQPIETKAVSRREFLRMAGLAGATVAAGSALGGVLASCGGATTTTTAAPATTAPAVTTTMAPAATTTSAPAATTTTGATTPTTAAATLPAPVATEWEFPHLSVLSGPVAFAGVPALWGSQYAAKVLNAAGGMRGVPVKITGTDTAWDAAKAVTAFTSVSAKALVVLGPLGGPESAALVPAVSSTKVMSFASYTTDEEIKDGYPWVAGYMQNSSRAAGAGTAKWLELNPDIKSAVFLYDPSDPPNVEEYQNAKAAAEAKGVKQLGTVEVKAGQLDLGTPAIKTMSYKPDGVVALLRMEEYARFAQEIRSRGLTDGKRLFTGFAAFGSDLISLSKGALEDSYIYNLLDPTSQAPEWLKLVEAYKKDFDGKDPNVPPTVGFYNIMMALNLIFEKKGITGDPAKLQEERQAISDAIHDGTEYDGIQGKWSFSDKGEMKGDIVLFQVKSNAFQKIASVLVA